jgi:hypothetical protein
MVTSTSSTYSKENSTRTAASQLEPNQWVDRVSTSYASSSASLSRQCQTARMKLMFIMSWSSINSAQLVAAINNQDSSLKTGSLPRNSTFGACSCRSLHLKIVSPTIRCGITSKQGIQNAEWPLPNTYRHFLTVRNQFDALAYFSILSLEQHCC